MRDTLLAGSYQGEFGWELMSWQGHIRKLSRDYATTVVSGPPGHSALYSDFCDTYLEHTIPGDRDCWKIHADHRLIAALDNEMDALAKKLGADRVKPTRYVPPAEQEFFVRGYGACHRVPDNRKHDVLFHFRLRHDRGQERNTPSELADDILNRLPKELRVACIGTKEEAICHPGYTDLRGLPLNELMDVISCAWLVTGPASGPLLLASLCNTPTVSWSSKRWYQAVKMDNKERMTTGWNPLKVPCRVLDEFGFQPPAIEAAKAVKEAFLWALPWKQQLLRSHAPSG
jgi:hypothetical protein